MFISVNYGLAIRNLSWELKKPFNHGLIFFIFILEIKSLWCIISGMFDRTNQKTIGIRVQLFLPELGTFKLLLLLNLSMIWAECVFNITFLNHLLLLILRNTMSNMQFKNLVGSCVHVHVFYIRVKKIAEPRKKL